MVTSGLGSESFAHLARINLVALCLAACPTGPQGTTEGDETGTTVGTTATSTEPTTTGTEGTAVTSGGLTSSSGTMSSPACGDGVVDAGEVCDDGNAVNGDGCNNDCSPSGELLWEYVSGESGYDDFRAVAAGEDGTIVVGGTRPGAGSGNDRWLARFDPEGEIVWSQNYDGAATAESMLAVAPHGSGIYATGNVDRADGREIWVGALDVDGGLIWEDEYSSGFGDDFATGAAVTAEGVVVAGHASVAGGLAELWVRGYSPAGEVQWTQTQPINLTAVYSLGPDVIADSDGIFVGGHSRPGQMEPLLAMYPPGGGAPTWSKNVPPANATIYSIARGGRDLLVAGEIIPGKGIYVERLTADGVPVWSTEECTGSTGKGVAVDSQGDVVVIGFGPGVVADNIRLCKFTADGELRWGQDLDGGVGDDRGFAVAILPGDRIAAVGTKGGEQTDTDAWLAVFSP